MGILYRVNRDKATLIYLCVCVCVKLEKALSTGRQAYDIT